MKTIMLFLLAALCSFGQVHAQASENGQVVGKVFDANGQAVAFANVLLYKVADSSFVKGEYTTEQGAFRLLAIPPATYWVQISFVGYETYDSEAFRLQAGQSLNLTTIQLASAANELEEVQVKAKRAMIEVQPDKTVFNVEGSINSAGNNALDLLRKSPGVVVDNANNIQLSGKDGVQVYFDGKPSRLGSADLTAQLRVMQASEIEAIEIITNPSARYDAEGNAGIINIRLKKDKRLGANANIDLGYAQGINNKYNGNTSFNYRNRKVNLYGTYGYSNGRSESWMDLYRIQGDVLYDQEGSTLRETVYNNMRLGADVFLNKRSTLGIMLRGNHSDGDWTTSSRTPITDLKSQTQHSILEALSVNDGLRKNLLANVNYSLTDHKGNSWNLDADWATYNNNVDTYQPNRYLTPRKEQLQQELIYTSEAPTDIRIYSFRADHERAVLGGKLEAGLKFSYVNTDNVYDFYSLENSESILDIDRSNQFVYDENINAAYMSFKRQMKKINVQLGLRAEQTNSTGELTAFKPTNNRKVNRQYLDLFPSLGVSYQLNQMNQLRINYGRRIDRPSYQALNPFEFKLSELSYSRGNPFLQPQYTNSISISHTYRYSVTTSLTYSHTRDFYASISDSTEQIRSFLETVNLDFQKVLNLNLSVPFSIRPWWNTYTNLSVQRKHNRGQLGGEGRVVDIKLTTGSLYHQSTFLLPKGFGFQVSGWYSSRSIWGAVYDSDANFSIDVGVQKELFDGRGRLRVALTDVFLSAPWRGVQEFAGFYVEATGGWESRRLRVNFSYLLGNDQVKKSRKRKTGMEAEAKRVK
ncbi:MAG: TonB-dependent receptor [Bacteroidota bacterium]